MIGKFSLPTGLSSPGTGCLGKGLSHHPWGFLKYVQMWHLKTRFIVGLGSAELDLMISKVFSNLNNCECMCVCVSFSWLSCKCPVLCPATRGFLCLPAGFGYLMILIILALNVMQSSPATTIEIPPLWLSMASLLPLGTWQRVPLPRDRRPRLARVVCGGSSCPAL